MESRGFPGHEVPFTILGFFAVTLLSITELPANLARSVPRASYFWQAVWVLVTIWLIVRLRPTRKAIAESAVICEP